MVKKRLEDLLREEAQKSPDSEAASEQVIELEATVVPETDPEPALESAETSSVSADGHARRTNPTKAELETTVKELKAALQASEAENTSLQQKFSSLQSDLQQQKTSVEKLQSELEQTKKVILQLSESNSKSSQTANNSSEKNKSSKLQNSALSRLPQVPHSPSFDSPTVVVSEPDIGWFD
jgi:uncharacterized protein YoxC